MIADDISNWILTLPKWQQKLSYLIMEKKHISEEELNGIYDVFKTETKLQSGKISEDIEKVCNVNLENSPNVIWQGVGNLHGVNKLKSNSELNVSSGLTVIYGENGSGKSGYTRLLNNAFISRGDQDILPNIFENKPEQVSADFKFSIDGNNIEYKYPDDKDAYAFKTIRNFDANDIMFNEVFYNDSITNDAYFEIVKKYFDKGNIDIYSSEEELIRQLIYAGNLHKHKSFKNEHEIRITTMDNKSPYGTEYALKEIGNVVKKVYILKPDIMGNSKGTSLEKIIDEVIVGPRSQQNINILRQYIYSNGLYDLADRITMSECPLR